MNAPSYKLMLLVLFVSVLLVNGQVQGLPYLARFLEMLCLGQVLLWLKLLLQKLFLLAPEWNM
jgi:hypothetical protein